jgi:phage tail-like protein
VTETNNPASTLRFDVAIDGVDIGSFTGLNGLSAQYEVRTYAEGGENGHVHQLPGRLTFGTVQLTRAVAMPQKGGLALWFRDIADQRGLTRHSASIKAFNDNRDLVAQWSFTGVWPVKYVGPSFSTDAGKVATEVFEFAHDGFTDG